jgi:acyl-CoA thioester hydrolase
MKIRVYYEDTDAGGIVYHTNYIKYCERARSEAFFSANMKPYESPDSGFIVKDLSCKFLATSKLGEILDVSTSLVELKAVSAKLCQEIYRDEVKIFSMDILLVYVNRGKPSRIPKAHREFLESY